MQGKDKKQAILKPYRILRHSNKTGIQKGGGVTTAEAAKLLTEMVIKELESEQVSTWVRPWMPTALRPRNVMGKEYNPMNNFFLSIAQRDNHYDSVSWLTEHAAKKMGGTLKKSDIYNSTNIFTWITNWITITDGKQEWHKLKPKNGSPKRTFILKVIELYNADQFSWVEFPGQFDKPELFANKTIEDSQCVSAIEGWIDPYIQQHKIKVHHNGDAAFYMRGEDSITMPPKESFKSDIGWCATYAHEVVHSTGHQLRLKRLEERNEENYSKEELVAEMGASLLLDRLGIRPLTSEETKNSVEYMRGWASKLSQEIKQTKTRRGETKPQKHTESIR